MNCWPLKVECSKPTQLESEETIRRWGWKEEERFTQVIKDACFYSHATLHLQGADSLHSVLHDVLTASGEFTTPALEMLLIVNGNLKKKEMCKYTQISLVQHVVSDGIDTHLV